MILFLDSSWYFYRYFSAGDSEHAWSVSRDEKWMPVSIYTGGAEHSVHLLYFTFCHKGIQRRWTLSLTTMSHSHAFRTWTYYQGWGKDE